MKLRLVQYSYDVMNSQVDVLPNSCNGTVKYDINYWPFKLSLIHKLNVHLTGD